MTAAIDTELDPAVVEELQPPCEVPNAPRLDECGNHAEWVCWFSGQSGAVTPKYLACNEHKERAERHIRGCPVHSALTLHAEKL